VLRSLTTAFVFGIALLMILREFSFDLAPLLASAGIAGVALGFGAQSLVKDLIAGLFMLIEDQYGVGDNVDLGEAMGVVESVGLRVTTDDSPDAVVCGPDTLDAWAPRAREIPVLACSLRPLGVRFAEPVPDGVLDVGVEIWSQPDGWTAWDPPTEDDLATDDLTQREVNELTAAAGSSLTDGGRLLSVADPASPPGMATFTEPLSRGGSLVLVRNPDPDRLDGVHDAERATARA
jgi:hypothetical protein